MSKKVLEALTEKYTKVQEGVKKIMGGQILDYEAKRILNKGKKEEATQNAYNLFKNGASYELVRASIEGLSDEELQSIYNEVCPKQGEEKQELRGMNYEFRICKTSNYAEQDSPRN